MNLFLKRAASVVLCMAMLSMSAVSIVSATGSTDKNKDVYQIPTIKPEDVDRYGLGAGASPIGWNQEGAPMCIIMRGHANGNTWIEKDITVKEAGWYGVTVNLGASARYETGLALKVSIGNRSTSRTVAVTSGYTSYENRYIGKLYLEVGLQTVRLEVTNKAAFVKSVTLGELQDDFVNDTLDIDINPSMVTSMDGYTEGDQDASYDYGMYLRDAKSFTMSVYTEKALCYDLTATYGTNTSTETLDISVNGYKQIAMAPADYTGNYERTSGHVVGEINLNRGMNEITFSLGDGSTDAVVMDAFQLSLKDSFEKGAMIAWVQENRVPDYYFPEEANSGFCIANGQKCASMQKGSWVEYDVYSEEERNVNLLIDMASSEDVSFSVSVNSEIQILNENIGASSMGHADFATVKSAGVLTIPAGYSAVRYIQTEGAGNLRSLTFVETARNEAIIKDFEFQNEDGSRMPYVVTEGLKGYAVATVQKFGEASDRLMLIVAEYADDRSLVGVLSRTIDVSAMADRETKTFRTEIVMKGEGGYMKAFLMREGTLEPLSKACVYEDINIFPKDILEMSVTYEPATQVLNNDGIPYAEYGLHNDDYDIDAIFYTGYKDTKVFAYMGIPKHASSGNPVPAMVLVHGGMGKAERDWVQKWNDLGYAAIAMDLYGCGPEDDPDSYSRSGKKRTPYAGVAPWDFSADFENAGMYQSVVNVINAHTLLRSLEEIDSSRIGITGISWGGITTTTVCGVDNRFMFAIPVYGCGYLDQCKTDFGTKFDNINQSIAWDPANFAAKAKMPILFVNSDVDPHFSINSSSLTYGVVRNGYLSIHHGLGHSQGEGDSIELVYEFAENMFNRTDQYIRIRGAKVEDGMLTIDCAVPDGNLIAGVTMYYIKNVELPQDGAINWIAVTDYKENNGTITVQIPESATYLYASIEDSNGAIMSTKFLPTVLYNENK